MEATDGNETVTVVQTNAAKSEDPVIDRFLLGDGSEPYSAVVQDFRSALVSSDYGKQFNIIPGDVNQINANETLPSAVVPHGMARCEKCGVLGDVEGFMKPSKRFCSTTCCKSYSAEKRYYPYGKDAKGVARSIEEGLLSTSRAALLAKRQRIRQRCRRQLGYDVQLPPLPLDTTRGPPKKRGRKKKDSTQEERLNSPTKSDPLSLASPTPGPIYSHPLGLSIHSWSLDDVSAFLRSIGCEAYTDLFIYHEIDGKALTLLKDSHLLNRLDMKLGPTLRIVAHVDSIKSGEILNT